MTWLKTGDEFPIDCAHVRLSDAAYRTHHEGLTWAVVRESDGMIHARDLKRFAETDDPEQAVKELVDVGFWTDVEGGWLIVHAMQDQPTREEMVDKRKKDAARQARQRRRRQGGGTS